MKRIMLACVLAVAILLTLLVVIAGPGVAGASDTCSVRQARRTMARERAQYREALHVYRATRYYSDLYRPDVGRWVRLARRCGWTWADMPWLMRQMEQESNGQPCPNGSRDGFLQILPYWWDFHASPNAADYWAAKGLPFPWDATSPRQTLIHARVMDRSNWWTAP